MRTESEIWKDIVGYEGYYQVSSLGRIKPLKRKDGRGAVVVNGFKAQSVSNTGYYRTVLNKDGEQFNISPHRLVATAFVPNL